MRKVMICLAIGTFFAGTSADAEMQQVRTPSGGTAWVPRPANFQECMKNGRSVGWDDRANLRWCNSPQRRFNRQ